MGAEDNSSRGDYPPAADTPPGPALPAVSRRYEAIFAQVAEGIFLFAAEGKRLVEANSACLRLLGYAAADLPTLTLYDLVAHDRPSIDANTDRLIREGRNLIGERDYRRKDGTLVPVEVSATALTTAGSAVLCVILRDLTARREAEERLREADRLLREAVDHAPLLLFTLDRDWIVTFARGRALTTLGLTAPQIVGRSIFVAARGFPAVPDNVRRALAGAEFDDVGHHRAVQLLDPLHAPPRRGRRGDRGERRGGEQHATVARRGGGAAPRGRTWPRTSRRRWPSSPPT